MTIQISSRTKEYLTTTITASDDPTADTVEFAFPNQHEPPSTWIAGDWVAGTTYDARIVVRGSNAAAGSDDVALAPGVYDCWVRVTDNPEIPVRKFDTLYVNIA